MISFPKQKYVRRHTNLASWTVTILGVLLTFLCFWPGACATDPLHSYYQAVNATFGAWHSPMIALLWMPLNLIYSGPQSMLVFQTLLCWGGTLLIALYLSKRTPFAWLLPVALFLPCYFNLMGVLWKDYLFIGLWLTAIGIWLHARTFTNRMLRVFLLMLVLLLFTLGFQIRLNAIFALFPFLFMILKDEGEQERTVFAGFSKSFVATAFWAALVFVLIGISYPILLSALKIKGVSPGYLSNAGDLIGVSLREGKDYMPPYVSQRGYDAKFVCDKYTLICPLAPWNDQFDCNSKKVEKQITAAWFDMISKTPLTFLKQRLEIWKLVMGIGHSCPHYSCPVSLYKPLVEVSKILPLEKKQRFLPQEWNRFAVNALNIYIERAKENFGFFFKPGYYFFAVLWGVCVIPFFRGDKDLLTLAWFFSASGLLFLATFLLTYGADDFRYSSWGCFAAGFALIFLLLGRKKSSRDCFLFSSFAATVVLVFVWDSIPADTPKWSLDKFKENVSNELFCADVNAEGWSGGVSKTTQCVFFPNSFALAANPLFPGAKLHFRHSGEREVQSCDVLGRLIMVRLNDGKPLIPEKDGFSNPITIKSRGSSSATVRQETNFVFSAFFSDFQWQNGVHLKQPAFFIENATPSQKTKIVAGCQLRFARSGVRIADKVVSNGKYINVTLQGTALLDPAGDGFPNEIEIIQDRPATEIKSLNEP